MSGYFLWIDGQQRGPFTAQAVQEMASSGLAGTETQIRQEGSDEWYRVGEIHFEKSTPQEPSPVEEPMGADGCRKSLQAYRWLAVLFGQLGVHNFYAGRGGVAAAQMVLTVVLCWTLVVPICVWIWALVESFTVYNDGRGVEMD